METTVYADLLFLVNAGMDCLCLCMTARLLHRRLRVWRLLAGTVLGGIYAVVALLLPFGEAASLAADVGVCFAMCALTFGLQEGRGWQWVQLCHGIFRLHVIEDDHIFLAILLYGIGVGTRGNLALGANSCLVTEPPSRVMLYNLARMDCLSSCEDMAVYVTGSMYTSSILQSFIR